MEKQDMLVLLLLPLFVIVVIWAIGVGECKRIDGGAFYDCAVENVAEFGEDARDLKARAMTRFSE